MSRHQPRRRPAMVAAGIALAVASMIAIAAQPASAGRSGNDPEIQLDGRSTYTLEPDGDVEVSAPGEIWFAKSRNGQPVTIDARLVVDDGTLPEPGTCEPASATFVLIGERRSNVDLGGAGSVCGKWTGPNSVVTHLFTGRYDVTDADRRKLIGTDGFFQFGLTLDGEAFLFAVDT